MEPAVRLASTVVEPLISQLLGQDAAYDAATDSAAYTGAGLGAAPHEQDQLLARLVSFRGEKPTLDWAGLLDIAAELVRLGLDAAAGRLPPGEEATTAAVLARTLWVIGELDTTDAQAVRLGPQDYARRLRSAVPGADRELSVEAAWFHDSLLAMVSLHLLHLLVLRTPSLATREPQRSYRIGQLVDLNDAEAVRGRPEPSDEDAAFEERYLRHVAEQYNRVTIYGIDLPNPNSPDNWSLDATYLSLGAEFGPTSTNGNTNGNSNGNGTAGGDGTAGGNSNSNASSNDTADPANGHPTTAEAVLTADRALGGHERVLLRGAAGSGKTTLIQWLALSTARGELPAELSSLRGRIPLLLPVRRFAREGFPAPDDFLSVVGHPLAGQAPDGWVVRVLAQERALLLVDGIDEAPEPQRLEVGEQLRRLLRIYAGNFCLVTSRPPAVDSDWLAEEGFSEFNLAPMNRDQVSAYITAWHTAARSDEGKDHAHLEEYQERLLRSIPLHRELRGLATNPLLCGLICALNRDRSGSLPKGRKDLYEAAMEMLLQRRDHERRVLYADDVDLDRGPRERLLRKLAYRMLVDERSVLDHATALEVIASHAPAIPATAGQGGPEEIFGHLLLRTGLLREQADGSTEFVHRTVQDYLSAKEAVEQGDFDLLLTHSHEAEWEEVIRMAVAHARPRECATLLEGLLAPGQTGMKRNRRRLLAAACLEHVTELAPEIHDRIRRETRNMVRPSTVAAARGLGWVGPIVLELLPDPMTVSDDEAYRLAVTATRVGDDAAVDYLARMRDHTSLAVRAELARGWHSFETERYANEIIQHLAPDGLYFPVSDRVELATLRELGGRERIQVLGHFTPDELLDGLGHEQLTHLWLAFDLGASMEWLGAFPHLTTLRVSPRLPRVNGVPEGVRIIA